METGVVYVSLSYEMYKYFMWVYHDVIGGKGESMNVERSTIAIETNVNWHLKKKE